MLESINLYWLIIAFAIIILYAFYQREINQIEKYYRKQIRELEDKIYELEEKHSTDIENARKEANESQRSTIKGQVSEIVAPWLMTSVNSVKELNFLGNPIDFVAFKGLDNKNETVKIKFIEVKTDTSSLNTKQRRIRDAVKAKRIEWEEVRIKTNENIVVDYK
tara:strand:- start:57 stop:548 length:492 start_codon:yes stop_codon:yes gene_type:complete